MTAAIAVALALGACGDDGPRHLAAGPAPAPTAVAVVDVAAQPCDRPTRDRGLGVVVATDLVATAAHTVDGERREITVHGAPARVVALDVRRDLALLATTTGQAAPVTLDRGAPIDAAVITLDGVQPVRVVRTGALIVTNVSDGTRSERLVHSFEPGVAEGTSGAPLITRSGAVAGIVLLDRGGADRADAVTAGELADLLAERAGARDGRSDAVGGCPH